MLATFVAALRFTLTTGEQATKTLPDGDKPENHLHDFVNKHHDYERPWIEVDGGMLISREAIVSVLPLGDEGPLVALGG